MAQLKILRSKRSVLIARALAAALLLLALQAGGAAAQAPDRQQAFVYGINAAIGTTYAGSFVPPSVDTIYLLADRPSVLSPRMTEIYFWAITNEYQASWELLNQPVAGSLEILRGGQVIKQTQPTSYTIQSTPRGSEADSTLYVGDEARKAHETFSAKQLAFRDAQAKYLEAQQAWMAAADEANRKQQAGEPVPPVPPEPQAPEPIDIFSNGLNTGIPVELPAGSYRIQLRRADGSVLPGSERNLVVFDARRTAVGYTVLPEARWTTPDQVDDLNDVIVGRAGSQIYLVPRVTREYPAGPYRLLQDPQQTVGENAEWTWVKGEPITAGELEIAANGQAAERRPLTPYRVKQVPGADLGYEVQPYAGGAGQPSTPDFIGFPLRLAQSSPGYSIRIVSPEGQALPNSQRLVRVPASPALSALLLLSIVPLAIGAAVILRRNRRLRLPRNFAG